MERTSSKSRSIPFSNPAAAARALLFLSAISLIAGWLHLQPKWKPSVSWFKNAESRLNHHLSGLFGVSSLAWTGHLVHVAIPGSRGEYVRWNNFLDVLPHPEGLSDPNPPPPYVGGSLAFLDSAFSWAE